MMKITDIDRMKAFKKALRETSHTVKPMVVTDKKKQANKKKCRKKFVW